MRKILIIEDDVALYGLYKTELELAKYDVLNVTDGNLAFEAVKEQKPDLVLLDLMLPGKNGLEILQEIRADDATKDTKVVMLTNFGNEENVSTALEYGALDYIMKYKIVPSELPKKVATSLGDATDSVITVTTDG
ncbi:response regulator [candidate division WWE3 bacterium]|nr:response regulator [candidate division WWE3 bacterium]